MPEEKEDNESKKSLLGFSQDHQTRKSEAMSEERLGHMEPRDSVQSELSQ